MTLQAPQIWLLYIYSFQHFPPRSPFKSRHFLGRTLFLIQLGIMRPQGMQETLSFVSTHECICSTFTDVIFRATGSSDFSKIFRRLKRRHHPHWTNEDTKAQSEDRLRPHSKWVAMQVVCGSTVGKRDFNPWHKELSPLKKKTTTPWPIFPFPPPLTMLNLWNWNNTANSWGLWSQPTDLYGRLVLAQIFRKAKWISKTQVQMLGSCWQGSLWNISTGSKHRQLTLL